MPLSNQLRVLLLLICTIWCIIGHVDLATLRADEVAIMQYDSRRLGDYWKVSAEWNKKYCDKHGHVFIYYASKEGCHHEDEKLATPWCKVKAMLDANKDFPDVKFFLYMDSDAVIDKEFANMPLTTMIATMQSKLDWDPEKKPIIFNQDGPCWWCSLVKRVGYNMCLNAGMYILFRAASATHSAV